VLHRGKIFKNEDFRKNSTAFYIVFELFDLLKSQRQILTFIDVPPTRHQSFSL
jgi:hypothetical protein